MRVVVLALLLGLAACGATGSNTGGPFGPVGPEPGPAPLPQNGPIAYNCADGTQLMVDVENGQARVAVIGGPSMTLPGAGESYYSNGRYGVRGGGRTVQWEVGRSAPVTCTGS